MAIMVLDGKRDEMTRWGDHERYICNISASSDYYFIDNYAIIALTRDKT